MNAIASRLDGTILAAIPPLGIYEERLNIVARLVSLGAALFWVLSFAMLAASGSASAGLMLVGPANDLHGSGTIASPGSTESWQFVTNPAGGAFTITGTPSSSLQLQWEILNPLGTVIAAATDLNPGDVLVQLDIPLIPAAGVWTIVVDGFGNTTGSYALELVGNADAHITGE